MRTARPSSSTRPTRPAERKLRPVHPNVGIRSEYRKRIESLVAQMARSYFYWVKAAYRATPPVLAQDSPARDLNAAIAAMGTRWEKQFDEAAPKLAAWFAQRAEKRSSAALRRILRDGGFSVKFQQTKAMKDVVDATIAENVGLIKSIGQQYHNEIQGLVMRSVSVGRDLYPLTVELQKRYGVTQRRAAFIARDQNDKATSAMVRVRHQELGITEAIWRHSHGGVPRPTHLANDGKRYEIAKGWFDPDPKVRRYIQPGELINCKCLAHPVVKGFS